MPFLRVHEIDLYYEEHGDPDAPALVLAHGAGGNQLVWWQQVPDFARDYRVITFDHRGFGRTRDVAGGPGRRAFAADLHALLDHLDVDTFAMLAHSMGGRTATPFAMLFPGRIQALVLSGTLGGAITDRVRAIQAAHARRVAGRSLRERALSDATRARDPALAHLYLALNGLNPRRARTFLAPTPGLATWRGSATALLHRLGIPLLFLVGAGDEVVPAEAMAAAHAAIPGSRYVVIPDAGHSAYFEQPTAYNAAVRAFLTDAWTPASAVVSANAGRT